MLIFIEKKTRSWDSGVPQMEGEAFLLSRQMEEVATLPMYNIHWIYWVLFAGL